jgi:hypothetical protein
MLERVLKYGGKPVTEQPSGKLSVTVWTSYGSDRKRWSDGKLPLEEQIPHVIAGLIRFALIDRAEDRKRAAEECERQRRAEEWTKLETAVKAEKAKVKALEDATAKWNRAEQIRSFVAAAQSTAVQNGQAVEPGSPFGDWIAWAARQADRLDPLKESPPSIIDRIPDSEPEPAGYSGYGYQKPERPFRFPKPIWRMT